LGVNTTGGVRFEFVTYSLEVPVNHIGGVEVAEAFGDIR